MESVAWKAPTVWLSVDVEPLNAALRASYRVYTSCLNLAWVGIDPP